MTYQFLQTSLSFAQLVIELRKKRKTNKTRNFVVQKKIVKIISLKESALWSNKFRFCGHAYEFDGEFEYGFSLVPSQIGRVIRGVLVTRDCGNFHQYDCVFAFDIKCCSCFIWGSQGAYKNLRGI